MLGRWIHSIYKTLAVLLILLCTVSTSAAEWYKDYEAGLDHLKKGRFGEAVPRLQSAIAQKNQEGLNIKFYGMKFDDYFPHYYLGKAYFNQKNYQGALKEFDISSSHGEIQRNRSLFQNLSELRTLASSQLALLNQPQPKPDPIQPKPEPIQPKPEPVIPEKKPEPEKIEPVPVPGPPAPTVEELNLQKTKTLIKDGARRYFQGDYDSAIASFSLALKLTPEEASAQFLIGCSYAAKYLLSGSSDQTAFQRASAAFQKIRRVSPNHPLTKSPLISPAVREMYQSVE
ncbi:tetratricopeptide repeat protein [bacterium]|nr:tetratricopeptide repeat protein [bacterium]